MIEKWVNFKVILMAIAYPLRLWISFIQECLNFSTANTGPETHRYFLDFPGIKFQHLLFYREGFNYVLKSLNKEMEARYPDACAYGHRVIVSKDSRIAVTTNSRIVNAFLRTPFGHVPDWNNTKLKPINILDVSPLRLDEYSQVTFHTCNPTSYSI